MKLVVDTNILITFFWKNSVFKKLLDLNLFNLFTPEFALEEINKYSDEIRNKVKLTKKEFSKLREELVLYVDIIPIGDYSKKLKSAFKIVPDKNDVDFFALALLFDLPLWSNDKKLKEQDIVKVYSTKEIIDLPIVMNKFEIHI